MKPGDLTLVDVDKPSGTTALVLGSSFSGKTSLLVHALDLITKGKYYDVIVVMTESINAEPLKKLPGNVLISNAFFPGLIKLAYDINRATNNRYRFLFVLDDIVNFRGKDSFQKLILTYRNSGISTIVLTQYSKLLAPSQRSSVHKIYFTGARDYNSREYIVKNWLKGHMQDRGILKKEAQDEWFKYHTRLGDREKKGDRGALIVMDNIRDTISVEHRPT